MKKIKLLLFSLFFMTAMVNAQTINGTISGTLTNASSVFGGVPVYLSIYSNAPSGGYIFYDTVYTNTSGAYSSSYSVLYNSSYNFRTEAKIIDCLSNVYIDSTILDTSSARRNPVYNFNFCNTSCNASWVDSVGGINSIHFINTSTPNHPWIAYGWNFGDLTGSNVKDPFHTYTNPGTYYVCLNVYDSLTTCNSQYCDTIVVGSPCNANFGYTTTGLTANFINNSTTSVPRSFEWLFFNNQPGPPATSTQTNPSYTFPTAGTYGVCLIVYDTTNSTSPVFCDSICKVVTVTGGSTGKVISGNITANSSAPGDGIVYLITADSNNFLSAVDSALIGGVFGNGYSFNVNSGTYYVKAALLPSNANYTSYLPTYYNNSLTWTAATGIVITTASSIGNHINLQQGLNPGGPAFIGGLVSLGANKAAGPGDPYKGASVILTQENGTAVAHTVTGADGKYEFANLAYGTYKLSVEIIGKTPRPITITLSEDNPKVEKANFIVNATDISTGIKQYTPAIVSGIYPNPASELVNISINANEAVQAEIKLIDVVGKELKSVSTSLKSGTQNVQIDIKDLPKGVYLVNLVTGNSTETLRLIKY